MAGTRQKGGWLSSGAATCLVLALIWRGGNGDLTALPQKSDPSNARKRDSLPPHRLPRLSQMYGHTNTKSKRAVDQSARMQLRPVSADLLDESLCVEDDWGAREWQAKEGVGRWGGIRKTKTQFKRWDKSRKASSHSAWWPLCPCVLSLYPNLSTLPSCPWVIARVILSSASSVVSQLWIWPETGSERDVPLHWYHAVSLTHLSQMPPTHPFWCLPSTCEWATVTGREGDRKGRGEGGGEREGH